MAPLLSPIEASYIENGILLIELLANGGHGNTQTSQDGAKNVHCFISPALSLLRGQYLFL